jgi:hypothetical protein
MVQNKSLKTEADLMIRECGLTELLAHYSQWFIGGSYSYDLMAWRDLDVYVLDAQHDLESSFNVAYSLTQRLAAKKSRFTNNVGNEPNGLYWGIALGDTRNGAWKLDLWFLDQASYQQHADYSAAMRKRLTAESRSVILEIKKAYWRRREYRDSITADLIYRAVLDHNVFTVSDFERCLAVCAARN